MSDQDRSEAPRAYRLTRRHQNEATADDCLAHRCANHAGFEGILNHNGPEMSECAICALQGVVDDLVMETLGPIVLAFGEAEGTLALMGANKNPKVAVLLTLLEALRAKQLEGDFELQAQKVIPTPWAPEPKGEM